MKSSHSLLLLVASSLAFAACSAPDHRTASAANASAGPPKVLLHDDAHGRRDDAVGSVTAIRRRTASAPSIADFTPRAGVVGSTVTISGSGFSANSRDDTVTFLGTPAEIRSASATQLVVQVPAGATTGHIAVASASASGDANGALAMDGSTAVTLTGAQNAYYTFTATAAHGYGLAVPGLAFTPSGGSLLVTLRAPDGTALTTCSFTVESSCDLPGNHFATTGTYTLDFDPSGPGAASFTAVLSADIGGPIQIDAAEPTRVTFARPGQNARYTFDGTAGQRIHVVVSASALVHTTIGTPIDLFRPSSPFTAPFDNVTLARSQAGLVLDATLPETGRYAVTIDPAVLASGSVALQLRSEASGTLTVDGSTAMRLAAGQNARYRFTAQAHTGYGLALTGLTLSPATETETVTVTVRKPDGTALASCSFATSTSCDLDPTTFATTGPYVMDIDPSGMTAATFSVVFSADHVGSVADGGASVAITRPGQNARIAVSGTAGASRTFVLSGTLDDGDPGTLNNTALLVFKPSSPTIAPIVNGTLHPNDQKLGVSLQLTAVLPETGNYTIFINPTGLVSGTLTLRVK